MSSYHSSHHFSWCIFSAKTQYHMSRRFLLSLLTLDPGNRIRRPFHLHTQRKAKDKRHTYKQSRNLAHIGQCLFLFLSLSLSLFLFLSHLLWPWSSSFFSLSCYSATGINGIIKCPCHCNLDSSCTSRLLSFLSFRTFLLSLSLSLSLLLSPSLTA